MEMMNADMDTDANAINVNVNVDNNDHDHNHLNDTNVPDTLDHQHHHPDDPTNIDVNGHVNGHDQLHLQQVQPCSLQDVNDTIAQVDVDDVDVQVQVDDDGNVMDQHEHEHQHEHHQEHEHEHHQQIHHDDGIVDVVDISSLQKELHDVKESNHNLAIELEHLNDQHTDLKIKYDTAIRDGNENGNAAAAAADVSTQLSNYQSALAMSETQKSQLVHENQILRQRCAQAGIHINDVISPVQVATGEEKAAADLAIDITETEALATMESVNDNHNPHAHAHAHDNVNVNHVNPHAHLHNANLHAHAHAANMHLHPSHVHVNPHIHNPHSPQPVHHTHTHTHHDTMTPNTSGLSSRSEEKWEAHFRDLSAYKDAHGNCLVPTSTELGRWLCRQRHNYRYKNLKEERRQRLMDLDKTCLGERIAELGSGNLNGHAGITTTTTTTDKDGNVTTVTLDENGMPALHSPPPINTKTKYNQAYESKLHEKWNKFFTELLEYKDKNGHCNFPTMNGSLGRWISRQRTLYRSKKLKADRYEKLVEIGFAFEDATALEFKGKLDEQWEEMFRKLLEHKEKKGHCFDVPETLPLGKWLYRQRWLYRHGNLREDRAEKLLTVGFEDKKVLKKGGTVIARDIPSGQPPRKKRKVEDMVDDVDMGQLEADVNDADVDNGEAVEQHTVAAAEVVLDAVVEIPPPAASEDEEAKTEHENVGPSVSV